MTLTLPIVAIIIASSWAFYNIFVKLAAEHIHPLMGLNIISITALVLSIIISAYLYFNQNLSFQITPKGVGFSILAGVSVLISEVMLFYLFSQKAALGLYLSFMSAGALIIITSFGILFLGEKINLQILAGFAFCILGVALLSKA